MTEEKMSDIPLAQGGQVASSEERQRNEGSMQQTVNENQPVRAASNCGDRDTEGYSYGDEGTIVCNGCHQNFGVLEPGDDIDEIHAQNSLYCRLLLSRKGKKFIEQHQTLVGEQNGELCKVIKENDRLQADNATLNRKMEDLSTQDRKIKQLERENKYLAERSKQQDDEIKALKGRDSTKELKEEKGRVLDLLKLQAREMEKKIKQCQELQKKVGEQNGELCKVIKENDRLQADIARLNRKMEDLSTQGRKIKQLERENKYLAERSKQQDDEIKALKVSDSTKELKEEKGRVVDVLKLQAREMEKKIKQCQELQKKVAVQNQYIGRLETENARLKREQQENKCQQYHGLVPEEAQEACIEMGYPREQVRAAIDTFIERNRANSSALMEILLEMEENRQCSEHGGQGQLAVGGNRYGLDDGTRCFYCEIVLKKWVATDDPWFEHARWSPDCDFVRQMKGQDFINHVQAYVSQREETEEVSNSHKEEERVEFDDAQARLEDGAGNSSNSENLEYFDDGREKKMDE